jgi:hypothetical protein
MLVTCMCMFMCLCFLGVFLCMCLCVCACVYACVCECVCACVYACVCVCLCVYVYAYVYVYVYMCMCMHMCMSMCMHMCMCMCMSMCTCNRYQALVLYLCMRNLWMYGYERMRMCTSVMCMHMCMQARKFMRTCSCLSMLITFIAAIFTHSCNIVQNVRESSVQTRQKTAKVTFACIILKICRDTYIRMYMCTYVYCMNTKVFYVRHIFVTGALYIHT